MRTRSLRNLIGIVIAATLLTVYAAIVLTRASAPTRNPGNTLAGATQMLKIAQAEKFQSDMKFADSNVEAQRFVGNQVKLGRLSGADQVAELNVREGGVIEYLLDRKDDEGKPLRVIYLPNVGEPPGSIPISWQCYSANWRGVSLSTPFWQNCQYDTTAWDKERRHVAALKSAADKFERDAEESRRKRDTERAQSAFEQDRVRSLREAERTREEEERQAAALERETERARIESERQRRGW